MSQNKVKLTLVSSFLVLVSVASYIYFIRYQPKALKKLSEVRGVATIKTDAIPYPTDAQKLGFNQTPTSKQTTFQTSKTLDEIQQFYNNIFITKGWELTLEKLSEQTSKHVYQKKNSKATIVATAQEDQATVVSIEVTGSEL
ncbi:hypothetical protein KKC62_02965 [Patescibacteria group bacterium]|nr:hypothetical protein [Patescibacteria group bacterium]MBU1953143.1 hypothetical protein [Patescibacteria group bacterium]